MNAFVIALFCAVATFAWGQLAASGYIGNRPYSIFYETRCLIRPVGLFRLIYFRPKHFGRHTCFEVCAFFTSYLQIPYQAALWLLGRSPVLDENLLPLLCGLPLLLLFFSTFAIAVVNEVGARRDEKKRFYLLAGEREVHPVSDGDAARIAEVTGNPLAEGILKRYSETHENSYFTLHNLRESYRVHLARAGRDTQRAEAVHARYAEYFRRIEELAVTLENRDGSLGLCYRTEKSPTRREDTP